MINIWYTTVKRNIFMCWILLLTNRLEIFYFSKIFFFDVWCSWRGNYESTVKHRSNFEFLNFRRVSNFFWTFLPYRGGWNTVWVSADYAIDSLYFDYKGLKARKRPHKTPKKSQIFPQEDFIIPQTETDFIQPTQCLTNPCLYFKVRILGVTFIF